VAAREAGAHFLLIGDGPLRSEAQRCAEDLGIRARMSFVGFQPWARDLHQVADVLAVTSRSEGSPLVVLEAMAARRPVVATWVGDIPRQVIDGETGVLVRPGDTVGLEAAVRMTRNDR